MAKKPNRAMHNSSINNQSKNRIKKAIEDLTNTRTDIGAMEQRLNLRLDKMMKEEMGTYLQTFEEMLWEIRALRQIFFEKGLVTEEELKEKHLELKKAAKEKKNK